MRATPRRQRAFCLRAFNAAQRISSAQLQDRGNLPENVGGTGQAREDGVRTSRPRGAGVAAAGLACAALLCGGDTAVARFDLPPERLRDLTPEWEAPRRAVLRGFHNLYNARVVHVPGDRYPYRMWLFGWPAADNNPQPGDGPIGDAIYHARSRDLDRWEAYGGEVGGHAHWVAEPRPDDWRPVLRAEKGTFDNAAAGDPAVVRRGGLYYMAYSAVRFEAHADTTPQRLFLVNAVMGAVSRDGIHWRKSDGPLVRWHAEYANRWDIAGGANVNTPPPGYMGAYHRPALLWDCGRWRLWFDYYLPGTFVSMGYAECRGRFLEPAHWRVLRCDDRPLLRDWPNASVVKVGRRYLSFSDAPNYPETLGGDGRQITVAESADGLDWRVLGHVRPEGRESSHVPEAVVLRRGRETWLIVFYAWKPETRSRETWDYRYKEIRWMRRRVR